MQFKFIHLEQKVFSNILPNLHIKWRELYIMHDNVCTFSYFEVQSHMWRWAQSRWGAGDALICLTNIRLESVSWSIVTCQSLFTLYWLPQTLNICIPCINFHLWAGLDEWRLSSASLGSLAFSWESQSIIVITPLRSAAGERKRERERERAREECNTELIQYGSANMKTCWIS